MNGISILIKEALGSSVPTPPREDTAGGWPCAALERWRGPSSELCHAGVTTMDISLETFVFRRHPVYGHLL